MCYLMCCRRRVIAMDVITDSLTTTAKLPQRNKVGVPLHLRACNLCHFTTLSFLLFSGKRIQNISLLPRFVDKVDMSLQPPFLTSYRISFNAWHWESIQQN